MPTKKIRLDKPQIGTLAVAEGKNQGWEFAHLFSERIARFLPKNE